MRRSQRQVSLRQFFTPHSGDTENKPTEITETIDITSEESPGSANKCRPFMMTKLDGDVDTIDKTVIDKEISHSSSEEKPVDAKTDATNSGSAVAKTKQRLMKKKGVTEPKEESDDLDADCDVVMTTTRDVDSISSPNASISRSKRKSRGRPNYKEITETRDVDECDAEDHTSSKKRKLDDNNSVIIENDSDYNPSDAENQNIASSSNANVPKGKNKMPAKQKTPRQELAAILRRINSPAALKKFAAQKKGTANKGPAKKRKTKLEKINDQLKAIGIKKNKSHGNCARAAIYKGVIKLTGNVSDLDQVVMSGKLPECGHQCTVTLRQLLEQPDYAGTDYEDGLQEATVFCDQNTEDNEFDGCDVGRTYVTRICSGNPEFDSGKFHNHCIKCKNFGKCIGDYRERHCGGCGKHYFGGFINSYRCPCRSRGRGFGGGFWF